MNKRLRKWCLTQRQRKGTSSTIKLQITEDLRKARRDWEKDFSVVELIPHFSKWGDIANAYRNDIVGLAVRYYAMADSVVKANDAMRFGVNVDRAIDVSESLSVIRDLYRIEFVQLLLTRSDIDQCHAALILDKVINRLWPVKDKQGGNHA